jgi:hypothetical protein
VLGNRYARIDLSRRHSGRVNERQLLPASFPPPERVLRDAAKSLVLAAIGQKVGPGRPKRQPQTPEEQARKEQILTNPGKGILAELRERKETIHVAAE